MSIRTILVSISNYLRGTSTAAHLSSLHDVIEDDFSRLTSAAYDKRQKALAAAHAKHTAVVKKASDSFAAAFDRIDQTVSDELESARLALASAAHRVTELKTFDLLDHDQRQIANKIIDAHGTVNGSP